MKKMELPLAAGRVPSNPRAGPATAPLRPLEISCRADRTRLLRVVTFVCLCAQANWGAARQTPLVHEALNLYDRGSYDEFFGALGRAANLHRFYPTFERDATRWVKAAEPDARWRRTLVASSAALEIAHLLRREPASRAARYLLWATLLMRQDPPPTPSEDERLWYLASVAGMQELDEPWALVSSVEGTATPLRRIAANLGPGGHLVVASARFPDEPRFKFAQIAAQEWPLTQISVEPGYLEFARRDAVVSDRSMPARGSGRSGLRNQAPLVLHRLGSVPELKRRYEEFSSIAGLRAEAVLHIGFLDSVAMNWQHALESLHRVATLTDDSDLLYLSQYLIGSTLLKMGDQVGAASAFERALLIVPNARSAATSLAAILLLSDRAADRDRAYALLQAAHSDAAPEDPWRLYGHGDARLWSTYAAALREALR
jgi:tetratricopeptide (TPR) repeat protein